MSLELLLNNVTLGKEILLVEDDMKRSWGESGEEGSFFEEAIPDLRSRHAGILLKDSEEVGSWYGWGDGEGMYLEGDGGPWVGEWEGRKRGLEWKTEDYGDPSSNNRDLWGGIGKDDEFFGEIELDRMGGEPWEPEREEAKIEGRRGVRRRRRRKRPWREELEEIPPPEAGRQFQCENQE